MSRSTYKKQPDTIVDRQARLNFGKHEGKTIQEVLEIDPQYLLYCQEQIAWFDLDHKIMDDAEENAKTTEPFDIWNPK